MEIMRCVKFIRCPIWLHSMLSNANPFQTPRRLPIAHVRYIKILTWLRGFLVIFLYLVLFSLWSSRLWELRDNGFVTIFCADSVSDLVSVIKRLNLYEFTLWGRDLVSVVRIRESPYYGFFFLRKYMRILSGHWKLSVLERCRYREVNTIQFSICCKVNRIRKLFFFETATLNNKTKSKAPVSQLMDEFDKCRKDSSISQQDPHNGSTLVCRCTWKFVRRSQGCVLLTSTNEQK